MVLSKRSFVFAAALGLTSVLAAPVMAQFPSYTPPKISTPKITLPKTPTIKLPSSTGPSFSGGSQRTTPNNTARTTPNNTARTTPNNTARTSPAPAPRPAPRPTPTTQYETRRPPYTPPRNDGYNTGRAVGEIIGGILNNIPVDQGPQRQPRYQNDYYEPQPVYRQPAVVQTPAVVEAPKNAAPKPVLKTPKPQPDLVKRPTPMTAAQRKAGVEQLDKVTARDLDELADLVGASDEGKKELFQKLKASPELANDPKLAREFLDAIVKGDEIKVQSLIDEHLKTTGESVQKEILDQTTSWKQIAKLRDKASDGSLTTRDIEKAQDQFKNQKERTSANQKEIAAAFDRIRINNQVRDILASATISADASLPIGIIAVIKNPNLPAGVSVMIGASAIMLGDPTSELSVTEDYACRAIGLPMRDAAALPNSEVPPYLEGGSMVMGPDSPGETVSYVLNNAPFSIQSGFRQALPAGTEWVIEFDRGGSFGKGRYTLTDGGYKFAATAKGWELFKHSSKITLNNLDNPQPFSCIIDNQEVTIPANSSKIIESTMPVVVSFDRGQTGKPVSKLLSKTQTLAVAMSAKDNQWDIFPQDAAEGSAIAKEEAVLFK